MTNEQGKQANLKDYPWRISYRSSGRWENGRPIDILHDFYIPALQRSVSYDRVAGYFRSTSLAAASQGFSAFVTSNKGKARFIVGADLDTADVQAILSGTTERLSRCLNAELDNAATWPEEVTRGVQLLAWMVGNGFLEVRVALRVHQATGDALPFSSVADGYVHEKWAIFRDEAGNGLYISGSLNESKTALTINAENIEVHCDWQGETDILRVEGAASDFEILWENRNPGIRVLTLPAAVKSRLIELAPDCMAKAGVTTILREIDGTTAMDPQFPPPSPWEWLSFAILKDGPLLPGGRYVGMETAPVKPWPHQEIVARRLIASWPYSFLLCDEVGLGKTIEAGLAIRSLYLAGVVRRVLIAAPAGLTRQWQREMAAKFLLPFGRAVGGAGTRHEYLLPCEEERSAASLFAPDLSLVSTGLLSRKERQGELRSVRPFDIVLLDEAQYARRSNPTQGSRVHPRFGNLYRTVEEVLKRQAKALWMATATPMQLHPVEACDLIRLTDRVGAFQFDPSLVMAYYDLLGDLVSGDTVKVADWDFLRQAVVKLQGHDPAYWAFLESSAIDGASRMTIRRWLERGTIPRKADLRGVLRLIFAASPLSRVMLRHTRSLLEIYRENGRLGSNLAKRVILPIPPITFLPGERQVYDDFQAYCEGLATQMTQGVGRRNVSAVGFFLSFLRLRFASSPFAIGETVRRRLETVESTVKAYARHDIPEDVVPDEDELQALFDDGEDDEQIVRTFLKNRSLTDLRWERERLVVLRKGLESLVGTPSKMTTLLRVLNERRIAGIGRIRQTVVFTRFYDTLTDIVRRLRQAEPGMLIGAYSGRGGSYYEPSRGKLVNSARDDIKHRFLREEIDVLICTDAAAEGLNLQTADLLINFDLPWNPMKVEQRIGRIDRIGQRHDTIQVLNLCYVDSAEQIVYGRLLTRLMEAGAIMGSQPVSLLPVTKDEFQALAEGTMTEEELEQVARARCEEMQRRVRSMEIPPQDLYDIYLRMQQHEQGKSPVNMETIWKTLSESRCLRERGCRVLSDVNAMTITLANLPGIAEGTMLTASRETYDAGLKEADGMLRFAAYGEPVFERLLEILTECETPACVNRITINPGADGIERVGYGVACIAETGQPVPRLITSMDDLEGLQLDEQRCPGEEDVAALRRKLFELVDEEFRHVAQVPLIEQINVRWGKSQQVLGYLVIYALIQSRIRNGQGDPLFWREIAALEQWAGEAVEREGTIRVPEIPAEMLKALQSCTLFDMVLPGLGPTGYLDAPGPLIRAAAEAACRLAEGMKEKKSEFTTAAFLDRLQKEMHRLSQV